MKRQFYRQLWKLRFDKMLDLEKKSIRTYQGLLQECKDRHRGHAIEAHLERLIADEKKHAVLVEELLKILQTETA